MTLNQPARRALAMLWLVFVAASMVSCESGEQAGKVENLIERLEAGEEITLGHVTMRLQDDHRFEAHSPMNPERWFLVLGAGFLSLAAVVYGAKDGNREFAGVGTIGLIGTLIGAYFSGGLATEVDVETRAIILHQDHFLGALTTQREISLDEIESFIPHEACSENDCHFSVDVSLPYEQYALLETEASSAYRDDYAKAMEIVSRELNEWIAKP